MLIGLTELRDPPPPKSVAESEPNEQVSSRHSREGSAMPGLRAATAPRASDRLFVLGDDCSANVRASFPPSCRFAE
jgi:hypothetical protein